MKMMSSLKTHLEFYDMVVNQLTREAGQKLNSPRHVDPFPKIVTQVTQAEFDTP